MAGESESKTETTPEAAPKKSKKLLWIVIAAVVLLGGAGAGYFVLSGSGDEQPAAEAVEATSESESPELVSLDTFLVNLNDPQGDRYLKLTMRLAISPKTVAEEASGNDLFLARLRDRVLNVLMRKTFAELSNPLGKDGLRLEIESEVNDLLTEGKVHEVLFSEFVVQ
jgi:flagellar FliL protein